MFTKKYRKIQVQASIDAIINNEIIIDGVTYKIISVTAWSDCDYKPKKVSELLAYLINGK